MLLIPEEHPSSEVDMSYFVVTLKLKTKWIETGEVREMEGP